MTTEMLIFILYLITVAGFAGIGYFLYRRFKQLEEGKGSDAAMTMLNQNVQGMQTSVGQSIQAMNERLDAAARQFSSLNREIGHFQEIGRSMKELQDFLKSPKLRGNVGEQVMKDLLVQILPKGTYEIEYTFKTGSRVDAIVKTSQGLISIDSKFPAENYLAAMKAGSEEEKKALLRKFENAIREHIRTIAKKYILPAEGTVDFALMYVPSESVFHWINNETDLCTYSQQQKIHLVSPSLFYAHLQTILLAFQGQDIEKRAKAVLQDLHAIKQESEKFGNELSTLNRHISFAKNTMDSVNRGFGQLSSRIQSTGRLQEVTVEEISATTSQVSDVLAEQSSDEVRELLSAERGVDK